MYQQGKGRHVRQLNIDGLHEGLLDGDPTKLLAIIHSLLDKSKVLIQSLERSIAKLESCEKETDFWKERYYAFKNNCELYAGGDLSLLDDTPKRLNEQQIKSLRSENQKLRTEIDLLRNNSVKLSPQFGASSNVRFLSNQKDRSSFGRDSKGQWESAAKPDSQLSTDRQYEPCQERMGPKHISFFRFSNKKKDSGPPSRVAHIVERQ